MKKALVALISLIVVVMIAFVSTKFSARLEYDRDYVSVLIDDARTSGALDDSWDAIYTENEELFVILFYKKEINNRFKVTAYKKTNSFFSPYQYIFGGSYLDVDIGIERIHRPDTKEYIILSSLNNEKKTAIRYITTIGSPAKVVEVPPEPFILITEKFQAFGWADTAPTP